MLNTTQSSVNTSSQYYQLAFLDLSDTEDSAPCPTLQSWYHPCFQWPQAQLQQTVLGGPRKEEF